MQVSEGIEVKFEDGKAKLEVDVAALVLNKLKAGLESGAIDPVPHTDLDKEVLLKAIEALKALKI